VDAEGVRHKQKVKASTRTQALDAHNRETVKVEREHALGVKEASDISTKDLLKRFRRHQKARVRPSTYERLGGIDEKPNGILKTLIDNLPKQAKLITRRSVAEFIEKRPKPSPRVRCPKRSRPSSTPCGWLWSGENFIRILRKAHGYPSCRKARRGI